MSLGSHPALQCCIVSVLGNGLRVPEAGSVPARLLRELYDVAKFSCQFSGLQKLARAGRLQIAVARIGARIGGKSGAVAGGGLWGSQLRMWFVG